MQRRFKDYFIISLKGLAMGAADAVPGVSGGTIAFISGIYEELISTISNVNLSLLTTLRKQGFQAFWKQLNGNFILALGIGIIVSFITFMRLAKYLIEQHPILIWSFFFGLIVVSVYMVGRQIKKWRISTVFSAIIGAGLAYFISTLPTSASNDNPYFLFIAGALAICAMVLPGISGAFILLILGAYKSLSNALHDFDVKKVIIFALGALVGLLSFSRVLKWLFKHYHDITLALLTGFIFGALSKIWPWKQTAFVMDDATGKIHEFYEISDLGTLSVYQKNIANFDSYKTVIEESVMPATYSALNKGVTAQLPEAIGLMIAGFLCILVIEYVGNKLSS